MSDKSDIEWTDATWNPVTGCTRVSEGCDNCYAVPMTKRLERMKKPKYQGLVGKGHFNGVVKCHESALEIPFKWTKPRRIFVNSMSDLFHEHVPFEFIANVFTTMGQCHWHTFQILTKRPHILREFFYWNYPADKISYEAAAQDWLKCWPNVWLGVSVEGQHEANDRIPKFVWCPAAVRFLSCEPLLEPIDIGRAIPCGYYCDESVGHVDHPFWGNGNVKSPIDWVIVGGESGPGARPCRATWIRDIVHDCKAAGVPVFVKQLGSNPEEGYGCHRKLRLNHRKGGNIEEWPDDLRIRQFPKAATEAALV
ncbi:MAG: phage Gp37/Gp68 family protein [Phycisphaerales bacterium]|nr:phage Gp37/Gp68 family protein [Phycisphaerales bacterium]